MSEYDEVLGDIKWLWQNWIAKGFVSMLVGDPGVGKSMIALALANIVLKGMDWPTYANETPPGKIVWIDTEASQQLLRIRSRKMDIIRENVIVTSIDGDMLTQIDILNDEHKEAIANLIREIKPELVVLDSLGGSHSGGENKVEDIAPIMKFFANLARDVPTCILMTHHLNKGRQDESVEISLSRIRGSTSIPQYTRTIIAVEKIDTESIKMHVIKNNLARIEKPLAVKFISDQEGDVVKVDFGSYTAPAKKKTKVEQCADWLLSTLGEIPEENEGIRVKDLLEKAEPFGYTKSNIYGAKNVLGERISVTGNGKTAYWKKTIQQKVDTNSVEIIMKKNKEKSDVR